RRLEKSRGETALHGIRGTVRAARGEADLPEGAIELPAHEDVAADPRKLMELTLAVERLVQQGDRWAVQRAGNRHIVIAPPALPLTTEELDSLYALPFTRAAHPSYNEPAPALEMIQFSITSHRGCGGGCSFCSLALHQGRRIGSRSRAGILEEARQLTLHPRWKGSITDVGGPSANMWGARCTADPGKCRRASCLYPKRCPAFVADQEAMAELLEAVSRVPGVNHVRVASGLRHDLALDAPEYVRAVLGQFTGGQIKLAPEHSSPAVLCLMRKPPFETFLRFLTAFERESARVGKQQYVVPYLMSAFPGCTDKHMRELAAWLRSRGWKPQQVQCFIPTPGTVATAMYYAGIDPEGKPVQVAKTDADRIRQHRILLDAGKSRAAPEPPKAPRRRKPT
ncbi:MAG: radical SAM protein, partial [Candidatus Hydrogenedentes bacterium]|nr:radical SAM protein [Candidatus Hydrogenedentota bacterium]